MPNDYFLFKQFLIKQDKCAMKVCTDACLFGAWVAEKIKNSKVKIQNALDVGSGTGLLSLMLAQKNLNAIIDAIEIDEAAAQQARENFEVSPWKERLHVFRSSIQQYAKTANKEYDVVICNPPFYENNLKSDDKKRNVALHSAELKFEELVTIANKLLNDNGNFFILLPYFNTKSFLQLTESKFALKEKILVKQTPQHNYFRSILWMTKQAVEPAEKEIIIMGSNGEYSDVFKELLKDYYLKL